LLKIFLFFKIQLRNKFYLIINRKFLNSDTIKVQLLYINITLKLKIQLVYLLMVLEPLEFLNGVLTFIAVVINIVFGLLITLRYFKTKEKEFLYVGIAIAGIYQPWWPTAVAFLSIIITGNELAPAIYFFIAIFFIPIFITLWMLAMNQLLFKGKRKFLPIIYLIISVLMDIYLVFYLVNDPNVIGHLTGPFDSEYGLIMMLYLLFILSSIVIMGIWFALKSLKIENPEIKLKAKFLILGFIFYLIGGFFDVGIVSLTAATLVIARTILILSSLFIYIGFLLPSPIKKLLIKE